MEEKYESFKQKILKLNELACQGGQPDRGRRKAAHRG